MSVGIDRVATNFTHNLPAPLDWVDQADGGRPATYLGQAIKDPNGESLTEFWNRSLHKVASLDGTAPGPGPASTPGLLSPDGRLSGISTPYVVADTGIRLAEPVVARPDKGSLVLYGSPNGRWHLLDSVQQVFSDGWCPHWCAYTYYKPGQRGTLVVSLGRQGYGGPAPPAHATVTVGSVRLDRNDNAALGRRISRVRRDVPNGGGATVSIPVTTPVRAVITIPDTIPRTDSEPRDLGAQVEFHFVPRQGA
jgi:hypothetical protein